MNQQLQALLDAYAAADKVRREGNEQNWEPQRPIHRQLEELNYFVVRHGSSDNSRFYLQLRNSAVVTYDTAKYKTE